MSARPADQVMAQLVCLLRTPWQWRRNDGGVWAQRLSVAVVALLLVLPALAAMLWLPPRAAAAALAVLGSMALLLLWALQFGALMQLDHPHAAHAVPGHARALRRTALGLWLAMVACISLGVAAAALPFGAAPMALGLAAAPLAGALLLAIACGYRWWWAWPVLPMLGALSSLEAWRRWLAQAWGSVQPVWQAQPGAVALLLLVLQGWLLVRLFGHGDAAHARAHAQRERMRRILAAGASGQKPTLAAYGRWGEWLGRPMQRVADAWLTRLCRRGTRQQASVLARADIVLQGAQHWVRQAGALLGAQALVALIFAAVLLLSRMGRERFFSNVEVGLAIAVFSMATGVVLGLPGALWQSRREQALLMLLPGMPQGAALNRALAWRQLRQSLGLWVVMLPAVLALLAFGQHLTLAVLAGVLPLQWVWLWRDVSRLRAPQPAGVVLPLGLCLALALLSLALLRWQPGLLLPWLLAMGVASSLLLAWRWRRLAALPQALPAGRLG